MVRMNVLDLVTLCALGAGRFGVIGRGAAPAFTAVGSRLTALVLTPDVHLPSRRPHLCR